MLFNSMHFLIFFVVVTTTFFLLPPRRRWILLLACSYYFYGCWNAKYLLMIVGTTVLDWYLGLLMGRTQSPGRRKLLLLTSLVTNLGLLFTFKYFNFVVDSLGATFDYFNIAVALPHLRVLLPVGISFYTFQSLSYTIDVYRGELKAEPHLGRFATFIAFFPQLVAGPIERASNLLPQMHADYKFDAHRVWQGLQLMGWGLFKKVIIADRLDLYVSSIYNNVDMHTGPSYLIATYLFAFQIYCDFSGYSDIAIGSAQVMGFDLMKNFDRPYYATTIVDFWRRWHISLSTWLRDYLYIPLGGNRKGPGRTYVNLFITMLLGGIWHGAAWTFVIWGALQGIMLSLSKLTLPARDRLVERLGIPRHAVTVWRTVVTFHLVCLSWVFFRANSAGDAFHILRNLGSGWPRPFLNPIVFGYGVPAVLVLLAVEWFQSRRPIRERLAAAPVPVRWCVYVAVIFSIVLFGVDGGSQFIYFQF